MATRVNTLWCLIVLLTSPQVGFAKNLTAAPPAEPVTTQLPVQTTVPTIPQPVFPQFTVPTFQQPVYPQFTFPTFLQPLVQIQKQPSWTQLFADLSQFLADGQLHVQLPDIIANAMELLGQSPANNTVHNKNQTLVESISLVLKLLQGLEILLPENMSEPCQQSLRLLLHKAVNISLGDDVLKDWSLAYFDSLGKPSAGALRGNGQWLGDFNQCVGIKVNRQDALRLSPHYGWPARPASDDQLAFVGKYCLLSVALPKELIPADLSDKTLLDLGDLTLKYGACFPSTCSNDDIYKLLEQVPVVNTLNASLTYGECQLEGRQMDITAYYLTFLMLIPICMVFVATCYDFLELHVSSLKGDPNGNSENLDEFMSRYQRGRFVRRFLLLFSCRKTYVKLFVNDVEGKAFTFIHGIRFLSIMWVIIGHTVGFMFVLLFDNLMDALYFKDNIIIQVGANAFYSVDTFLFLSGFSFAYFLLEDFQNTQVPGNILLYYIGRFFRIMPSLILIQIFVAGPFMAIGYGPLWPRTIEFMTTQCRNLWWEDLLLVNNLRGSLHSVCMGGDWYLAVDFQMFIVAVPVVILMSRKPKYGVALCGLLILASGVVSIYLFMFLGIKSFIGFTIKSTEIMDHLDIYYQVPWTRMAVYFQGVLLGYYIHVKGLHNIKIKPRFVLLGWAATLAVMAAIIFGTFPFFREVPMPDYLQILHGLFSKPAWGLVLSWVVLACSTGNGGIITSFLSMRVFWPLGRLTYCLYLVHGIVISHFMGNVTSPVVFQLSTFAVWFLSMGLGTIVLATVLYTLVEGPIGDARKVFIKPLLDRRHASRAGFVNLSPSKNGYHKTRPSPFIDDEQ